MTTKHAFGVWYGDSGKNTDNGASACAIIIPTADTVVINVTSSSDDGDILRAYQWLECLY